MSPQPASPSDDTGHDGDTDAHRAVLEVAPWNTRLTVPTDRARRRGINVLWQDDCAEAADAALAHIGYRRTTDWTPIYPDADFPPHAIGDLTADYHATVVRVCDEP